MDKKEALKIMQINSEQPSAEVLKKQYKLLAKRYHPDNHNGDEIFDNLFKLLNEAYTLLINERNFSYHNESENNNEHEYDNYYQNEKNNEYKNDNYSAVWCVGCEILLNLTKEQYLKLIKNKTQSYCEKCLKDLTKKKHLYSFIRFLIPIIIIGIALIIGFTS